MTPSELLRMVLLWRVSGCPRLTAWMPTPEQRVPSPMMRLPVRTLGAGAPAAVRTVLVPESETPVAGLTEAAPGMRAQEPPAEEAVLRLLAVRVRPTFTTVGVVPYGVFLAVVFVIPVGVIKAMTGIEVTLNVLAEFIGGMIVQGNALAMNFFKSFG